MSEIGDLWWILKIKKHFRPPCLVGAVCNCADLECLINSKVHYI